MAALTFKQTLEKPLNMKSKTFAQDLLHSFHTTGFAVITNHGVSQSMLNNVPKGWKEQFFFKPDEYKQQFDRESMPKGAFGYQAESCSSLSSVADNKQYFELKPKHLLFEGASHMPVDFDLAIETFALLDKLNHLAFLLTATIEKQLVETYPAMQGAALSVLRSRMSSSRINYFPAYTGDEPDNMVPAYGHRDLCFVTMLAPSQEPGLWVQDQSGERHYVPYVKNCLVVNAGEYFSLLTGGKFDQETAQVGKVDPKTGIQQGAGYIPGTFHGVDNLSGRTNDRMSIPLFGHLEGHFQLDENGLTPESLLQARLSRHYKIKK